MTRHLSLSRFFGTKHAIASFVLLAMLVSAFAPKGFMPTQTASGFAIKLCSGHADSKLVVAEDHPDFELLSLVYDQRNENEPDSGPEQSAAACAFASGVSIGLASSAIDIANKSLAPAVHEPSEQQRFALRNRINIPPATGPPAIV